MKQIKTMTQAEVAAYVHTHLKENGIDVVLSGGTVVEIYSNGLYVSHDIDLIPYKYLNPKKTKRSYATNWL